MKVKDTLVVRVHTVQGSVNMSNYNNSYFCVTFLEQFNETGETVTHTESP